MLGRSVLRSIYRALPPSGKGAADQAYTVARSLHDIPLKRRVFGDKAELVPPLYLMEDGARDYVEFRQNGLDAFKRFLDFDLKPTDRILDIGSGIGRKTLPLLDFLTTGSYEGIDPVAKQVKWCAEKITPRYPNFRFHRVDVWSKVYNPRGRIRPAEYIFPFRTGDFDFIILGSVFTHMFSPEMQHYIDEISRVLKPGAHGWITFFLLNRDSESRISLGQSTLNLVHEAEDGARADNPTRLETAVGHQEVFVLEMFRKRGIKAQVSEYGAWCGRQADFYQDIVNITKV